MNAYGKTLTHIAVSHAGVAHGAPFIEGAFGDYVPMHAPDHPAYRLYAVIAMLCPPLGLLAYFLFTFSPNSLDRALGKALLWRAITLPAVIILCYWLVTFLLHLAPQYRPWSG